jgi:hypothetical protein
VTTWPSAVSPSVTSGLKLASAVFEPRNPWSEHDRIDRGVTVRVGRGASQA